VIRVPTDQLEYLGPIEREARSRIAAATEKTVSAGYGLRLLPDAEDERLRKDARRLQSILGKLTLNLPCFGLWMPNSYWELFQRAKDKVQADGISSAEVCAAAARRLEQLDGEGIEHEVDGIIADLQLGDLAKPGREAQIRAELLRYFRTQ
jgi:hypothetical protein